MSGWCYPIYSIRIYSIQYLRIYSVQYLELRWGEKSSRILLSGLSVFVSHRRRSPEEATDAGMVQG